jgi:hypothetical protein
MIFIALLFFALGFLVKHAKMYFLIAGYNTMPAEEKAKTDVAGIATLFRNVMWIIAVILLIGWVGEKAFKVNIESYVISGTVAPGMIYLLIKSNSKKCLPSKK